MANQEAVTRYQAYAGAEKQASQEPGASFTSFLYEVLRMQDVSDRKVNECVPP